MASAIVGRTRAMSNPFIRRQRRAKPLSRRAVRRRLTMTPREQERVLRRIKAKATREVKSTLREAVAARAENSED